MKINRVLSGLLGEGEIIAYFGQAKLVRRLDSRFEIRGGSPDDHGAAREWISLFMHEIVLAESALAAPSRFGASTQGPRRVNQAQSV